jgi:hypothetical protein
MLGGIRVEKSCVDHRLCDQLWIGSDQQAPAGASQAKNERE